MIKNMSRYILGNTKRIFNPCRICKHRDTIDAIACGCTKNFFQVVVENIKINLRKKNKIVNVISSYT